MKKLFLALLFGAWMFLFNAGSSPPLVQANNELCVQDQTDHSVEVMNVSSTSLIAIEQSSHYVISPLPNDQLIRWDDRYDVIPNERYCDGNRTNYTKNYKNGKSLVALKFNRLKNSK